MNDSGSYGRLSLETSLALERARLVRLCAKITGDGIIAEDLAQETLLEAWRHIDNLRSRDKLPRSHQKRERS
jgi:DNA-directed RNA polymerase specialized sigma24 family protein